MASKMIIAAVLPVLAQSSSSSTAVTPVEKVIELLHDMRSKLEQESADEASTYDNFACYCKDTTVHKSTSIKEGQTTIDTLSAEVVDKTATKEDKEVQLGEAKTKLEELKTNLKETEVRCAKEKATYQEQDANLRKAISSLDNAIRSMEAAKPGAAAAGLLTVKQVMSSNPVFSNPVYNNAMKILDGGAHWGSDSFLQVDNANKVDPNDPEYKHHSQGIIDLLNQLFTDFKAEKEAADTEFAKAEAACDKTKTDLIHEIDLTDGDIMNLEGEIGDLTSRLAEARTELVESDFLLKEDKLYLTDLTEICETRANQYDQRSAMRGSELTAMTQALDILETKVATADASVNKRALLAQVKQVEPLSFVQVLSSVMMHNTQKSNVQIAAGNSQEQVDKVHNVLSALQQEGKRIKSALVMSVVARAAADPFAKVKGLIQKLVERLIAEATAEASKKGFCDTELGKAKTERDFRLEEVNKLSTEIGSLEVKHDALDQEIADLTQALEELAASAAEAKAQREESKKQNQAVLKEAREGHAAVAEAIGVLKTFYKQAAKASSLLQVDESPIAQDNPGAGFSGSYKGNQAGAQGIMGLLEVIKTDFEHTITVTEETEKTQAAEYVEFDRATKADIGAKETKKELDEADLKTTIMNTEEKTADMKSNMNLLDDALSGIEELKPMCIDNGMSYEMRVQKREEEMAALKKALCQLDGEGVEEECLQ
jgi:DNA repair exonuclease SbcCD ATPase subunit